MPKRREPRSTTPPNPDASNASPPDLSAVEQAIRSIVDRLKPKPAKQKPKRPRPS